LSKNLIEHYSKLPEATNPLKVFYKLV
jgi:hypothetical protein